MRNKHDKAQNADLWDRMLKAIQPHTVECVWVKGHAGNKENERCDELGTAAADGVNLQQDEGFENPIVPDYNFGTSPLL